MTQYKCDECLDTGHKLLENGAHSDYLDCSCEVAQERIAIEREALSFAIDYKGGLDQLPADLRWHFHQRARKIERDAQASRIADLERQLSEHKAARIAYASEFQLDKNGDHDVGNIHANIRALKAQLAEASAPAIEPQLVALNDPWVTAVRKAEHYCPSELSTTDRWRWRAQFLLNELAAPQAAEADKVREAIRDVEVSTSGSKGYAKAFNDGAETMREAIAGIFDDMAAQAPVREVPEWQPIDTAPKDMASRLYLLGRYCVQGFTDAAGELMVQSEISPHWRKMRGKPTHWMPLPAAPVQQEGGK